jgi:hypothetical protein
MVRFGSFLLLASLVATGCSRQGPALPTPVEARGKVLLPDGQPLKAGRIELHSQETAGVDAFADLGPDGSFVLRTYKEGDGAVPGKYKATISPFNYRSSTGSPVKLPDARRIPPVYLEASTTPWAVEVTSDGDNAFDLKMTAR